MLFLFSVILLDPLSPIDSSPNSPPPPPSCVTTPTVKGSQTLSPPLNRLYIYDIDPSKRLFYLLSHISRLFDILPCLCGAFTPKFELSGPG